MLGAWQFSEGLLHLSDSAIQANQWFKISNVFTVLVVPFGIIFAFNLFNWRSERFKAWVFVSQFIPAIILAIANLQSDQLIVAKHVQRWHWLSNPIPNWVNILSYGWIFINGVLFIGLLFYKYYSTPNNKLIANQALILGFGFAIPYLSGITFEMVLPFVFNSDVFPITVSLMTIFSISAIIVIKKYRLLDFSPVNQWDHIINSLEEAVFITDKNDTIMYVNETFCKMVQQTNDELIGIKAGTFFPEATERSDSGPTNTGKSFNTQIITKSGSKIWVQVSSSDYIYHNKVIGHIALLTNVDNIKLTKQSLADERNKVKMAFESGQMVSYQVDLDTKIIELSENASQILGIAERFGPIYDIIFPYVDVSFKYLFDKIAAGEQIQEVIGQLIEFKRPDNGQIIWLELKTTFSGPESNDKRILRGLLIDITEDQQKTHELLQLKIGLEISKNRLLQAQEIAHLGSWEVNLKTQNLYGLMKPTGFTAYNPATIIFLLKNGYLSSTLMI